MICWIVYLLGFVLESDLGRARPENGVAELSVPTSQRKITRYLYHLLALRGFALSRFVAFGESRNIICMYKFCLLYTSPSPRDATLSRMPSSA